MSGLRDGDSPYAHAPYYLAGHVTITLEWEFAIMPRRRKSGITTRLPYIHSDANATFAAAGLRFRRTRKYVSCYTDIICIHQLNMLHRIPPMSSCLVLESKSKIGIQKKMVDLRYMVCQLPLGTGDALSYTSFSALDLGAGPSSTGDAIASLEKTTVAEENLNNVVKPRISMLSDLSGRRNLDPYTLSKKLRSTFRETKKAEKRAREEEDSVRNKFSLSTELELVKEDDVREEAREEWQRARREYKLEEDVRQKTFRSQHGSLGLNSHPKMKSSRVAGSSLSSAKSTLAASLLRNSLKKSDPFTTSSSSTSLPQATRARHS